MTRVQDDGWQLVTNKKLSQHHAQQDRLGCQEQSQPTASIYWPKLQVSKSEPRVDITRLDAYERSVINAVTVELDLVNLGTFANWYDKFEIHQLSTPSGKHGPLWTDSRLLEVGRGGRAVTVPVRYVTGESRGSRKVLLVLLEGGSIPLPDWISATHSGSMQHTLPSDQLDILGEDGWEVQSEWWRSCGFICDFQGLLPEIQDRILLHAIGQDVELLPWLEGEAVFSGGAVRGSNWGWRTPSGCLSPELLLLNKSVCQQIRRICSRDVVKTIDLGALDEPPWDVGPRLPFLNKLQLSLNDEAYYFFFGVELRAEDIGTWRELPDASLLRELKSVRSLEINFLSPIHELQSSYGIPRVAGSESSSTLGCRKAVHDIILTFAFEHIRHFPTIKLSGFLKTSTRDRWEPILKTMESRRTYAKQVRFRKLTFVKDEQEALPEVVLFRESQTIESSAMSTNNEQHGWTVVTRRTKKSRTSRPVAPTPITRTQVFILPTINDAAGGTPTQSTVSSARVAVKRYSNYEEGILRKAKAAVIDFNNSSFDTHVDPFTVARLSSPEAAVLSTKPNARVLDIARDGRYILVLVRMVPSELEGSKCELRVVSSRGDGDDLLFSSWLSASAPGSPMACLPSTFLDIVGAEGYEIQYRWWCARDSTFDLASLSEEIQDHLLLHAVGEVHKIYDHWGAKAGYAIAEQHQSAIDVSRDRCTLMGSPGFNNSLLYLDKATRRRVKHLLQHRVLKRLCGFRFGSWYERSTFTTAGRLPFLKKLQLTMNDFEYLDFFGTNIGDSSRRMYRRDGLNAPAAILSNISSLKYLELWFEATLYGELCNPWQGWVGDATGGPRFDERIEPLPFPCRKATIDMILGFGYQHIKHIPSVRLTGYIKDSTKDRWSKIFSSPNRDHVAQRIAYRASEYEGLALPPQCFCPKPCGYHSLYKVHPHYSFLYTGTEPSTSD
ncbi:hypothetical protein LTR86_003555 [Recurvomyces mirabilis]|nr:hypothetical protein LTR86_003555 [Recurvomyces mirabilis]